jgi:hypothetical protein
MLAEVDRVLTASGVVSELALLEDDAYARGLARLRYAAAAPSATVPTTRSRLQLTARRAR